MSKRIVVDASAALAWILQERVSQEIPTGVSLVAPELLFYEVASGIKAAFLSKRISLERTFEAWDKFILLEVDLMRQSDAKEILKFAISRSVSTYDAAYFVLALQLRVDFLTFDKKLILLKQSL